MKETRKQFDWGEPITYLNAFQIYLHKLIIIASQVSI